MIPGCGADVAVFFGVWEDPVEPGEFAVLLELVGDVCEVVSFLVVDWLVDVEQWLPSRPSALSPKPCRKMKAAPWAGSEVGIEAGL